MNLYAHQKRILDLNPRRYLIAHSTGTGKTITSLALAKANGTTALIVCPKALKENWRRQIQPFNPKHLVISKEELRRDWDSLSQFNAIIIDEFHFFANLKSQLSKALQKYIKKHNPTFVWGLTATPYCSSPMNIYALAKHLGHNWDYWKFHFRFFNDVRMGSRVIPVVKKGIEKDVAALVKSIGDTCTLEECVDVPEQTFETVYLETTKEQEKAIKSIDDTLPIVRFTRQHTIENGLLLSDGYSQEKIFECLKNDYIASVSEENPKIAVFCRYNRQIDILREIMESKGKKVIVINGQTKDRDGAVQEIEASPEVVALIQASCSVGFEIPSVPLVIFASLSYSYIDYKQALGRVLRINKLKKNHYIHLVVKDGVDESVYDCIMAKEDFNIEIYANRSR